MPFTILVPLILVGLAAVLFAVRMTGGSASSRQFNAELAEQIYQKDQPHDSITDILVANPPDCAFLVLKDRHAIGFAILMGRHTLTRRLDSKLVRDVSHAEDKIVLKLADFTLPKIDFQSDPQTCEQVVKAVARISEPS